MNPELLRYVQKHLDRGVDVNALRKHLLKHYSQSIVDEHMDMVILHHNSSFTNQPLITNLREGEKQIVRYEHELHIHKSVWFFLFIFIIAVGSVIYGLQTLTFSKVPKQLDVIVEPTNLNVTAGAPVEFRVLLTNLGKSAGFDVHISYMVSNKTDTIVERSESRAIQTRTDYISEILLPSDLERGVYNLKVNVSYSKYYSDAGFSFRVD